MNEREMNARLLESVRRQLDELDYPGKTFKTRPRDKAL